MRANKKQHWIPDSYLQAWADPVRPACYKPFVHVFAKDGSDHRARSPRNLFSTPELYTIKEGDERDLSIEHYFSRIEQNFVTARNNLGPGKILNEDDAVSLYAFTAAMLMRLPRQIDHFSRQWKHIAKVARSIRVHPGIKLPSLLTGVGRKMTIEDVEFLATNPMRTWFPEAVDAQYDVLSELFGCDILVNGSPYPFLTSDNPAVIRHPPQKPKGLLPRGLNWPGCTITFPISPMFALRFSHGAPGIYEWIALGWEEVFEINCFAISAAHELLVSCWNDLFYVQSYLDSMVASQNHHEEFDEK